MSLNKLREWANEVEDMEGAWAAGYDAARHHVQRLLRDVTPVVQRMSFSVVEAIPEGWQLHIVDASLLRIEPRPQKPYKVGLCRSTPHQWAKWTALSELEQDTTYLYLFGTGATLNEALAEACQRAMEVGTL